MRAPLSATPLLRNPDPPSVTYRDLARPDVPIRAVVAPDQASRYAEMLRDIEVVTHEPNVAELDGFASEVEAADRV